MEFEKQIIELIYKFYREITPKEYNIAPKEYYIPTTFYENRIRDVQKGVMEALSKNEDKDSS